VFAHTSQVLLVSDQTSGAGVLLESTRLRGVLRGNALGQPQIINMLPDERVKPGERVITSGGDQIYPRGLPVGVVEQVVPDTQNPPYMDIVIKPAANLGHLEELLVITQAGDQMPRKEQQDLAQSAAEGAIAATQQRASDVLAERLPGLEAPDALADNQKPAAGAAAAAVVLPPLHPPPALHADHFSPQATPPAGALTPGQLVVDPRYPPLPKSQVSQTAPSVGESKTPAKKAAPDGNSPGQSADAEAGVKPKRPATTPATPDDGVPPGTTHSAVAKPKTPKPAAPAATVPAPETSAEPPAEGAQPQ
jgi:rod shape-determining protein MreC